ncbi:hypothetical protein AVEN_6129-1 [Araneus ventricosus]|uniref:Uncharacterized protein n=1 Tax=Araneus ventricosus TaxID=182803 RepID=A0A4Y2G424_ARAVE|nr:hypothetical protein AVEN_6129-1 [Araneus ventricosus]
MSRRKRKIIKKSPQRGTGCFLLQVHQVRYGNGCHITTAGATLYPCSSKPAVPSDKQDPNAWGLFIILPRSRLFPLNGFGAEFIMHRRKIANCETHYNKPPRATSERTTAPFRAIMVLHISTTTDSLRTKIRNRAARLGW